MSAVKVESCAVKVESCADKIESCADKIESCADKIERCADKIERCAVKVESCEAGAMVPPNDCSNLINASDVPQAVEFSRFTKSNRTYLLKATFCKENVSPPDSDINSVLVEKCESTCDTTCLLKSSEEPIMSNVPENNTLIQSTKTSDNTLKDDNQYGILISVPFIVLNPYLPNNGLPQASDLSHFDQSVTTECFIKPETESQGAINNIAISGAYSVKESPSPSTSEADSSQDQYSLAKLLYPLYKYFPDNKCLICGFVSTTQDKYNARKHLATHLTEKHFKCDNCEKSFTTPERLSSHKMLHTEKLAFSCDICSKKFKTRSQLRLHMKRHDKSKLFPCIICDKQFSTYQAAREHQTIHTGEMPYQCSVCKKKFRTADSLRTHTFSHNTEKRFTCHICNKGYNRRGLLSEHLNSHNKTNAFKCKICDKTFNFKSNRSQHMLTHSGLRKHTCETCGMKFKFPHHLKNHIVTHDASDD